MALVLDTGVLLALLNAEDANHAQCAALIESADEPLIVPSTVLVELSLWVRKRLGFEAWKVFCEDVVQGAFRLHALDETMLTRAVEIDEQYADLDLGLVDASVIALCEALGETKVATLDRRDFAAIRPAHRDSLTIVPA